MFFVIETTTNDLNIANIISEKLLKCKLSPCVQIIPNINSYYLWKDQLVSDSEFLIKIKIIKKNINKTIQLIKKNHNYDNPEFISYKFNPATAEYKNWFIENSK